jgi:hypothetical protein
VTLFKHPLILTAVLPFLPSCVERLPLPSRQFSCSKILDSEEEHSMGKARMLKLRELYCHPQKIRRAGD